MISCHDLTHAAGGKRILDSITTAVPASGITALVGPNGAGKSTLLTLMGRLASPASGAVHLSGRDITAIPRTEFARQLTILRQATRITPRLTVRDLVGFGRYPHGSGHLSDRDRAVVATCLTDMALDDLAERQLDTLSGGQQQRALIAMVLAQETPVLLLDEPLNNLDLTYARRVMNLLARHGAAGRTIVVVLHDLTIAARFADHVIALKDGRLLAEGAPSQVFSPETLRTLFDTEVEVHEIAGKPVILPI
ncbi:ABC ferric siderophore transporter, ATPase subunit [Pseudooceanicola batsensis HTCC2597]|uniref:ABC ferric siderophore transporter, ATPase subunit n=1 Tax=Pseudooceanicola batsensis (strain ATCC BAA-863 / DSM 15984 / KCTC 12145 / HTCC2597) TaxID=252305 RepID=A3TU90_PSEBH|nr:ATP-binding cassette domain-containing protein [Pseudooceanicola batsensis]EAQ04086.1 ABC ferric siderophore transporter, ATPase subunit [Pseudooceanicola batsensis HTCC2597]